MEHDSHFGYTFIMAAIRHAARVAHGPQQRAEAVLYYCKTLAADLQKKGHYDLAFHARKLVRELGIYSSAFAVARLYGATDTQLTQVVRSARTPASNTGVNSSTSDLLEGIVSYER